MLTIIQCQNDASVVRLIALDRWGETEVVAHALNDPDGLPGRSLFEEEVCDEMSEHSVAHGVHELGRRLDALSGQRKTADQTFRYRGCAIPGSELPKAHLRTEDDDPPTFALCGEGDTISEILEESSAAPF